MGNMSIIVGFKEYTIEFVFIFFVVVVRLSQYYN